MRFADLGNRTPFTTDQTELRVLCIEICYTVRLIIEAEEVTAVCFCVGLLSICPQDNPRTRLWMSVKLGRHLPEVLKFWC